MSHLKILYHWKIEKTENKCWQVKLNMLNSDYILCHCNVVLIPFKIEIFNGIIQIFFLH